MTSPNVHVFKCQLAVHTEADQVTPYEASLQINRRTMGFGYASKMRCIFCIKAHDNQFIEWTNPMECPKRTPPLLVKGTLFVVETLLVVEALSVEETLSVIETLSVVKTLLVKDTWLVTDTLLIRETFSVWETLSGQASARLLRRPSLEYRKVASSNTSCLEAHAGFFRSLMKGIFDPYTLWPFDKKLIS